MGKGKSTWSFGDAAAGGLRLGGDRVQLAVAERTDVVEVGVKRDAGHARFLRRDQARLSLGQERRRQQIAVGVEHADRAEHGRHGHPAGAVRERHDVDRRELGRQVGVVLHDHVEMHGDAAFGDVGPQVRRHAAAGAAAASKATAHITANKNLMAGNLRSVPDLCCLRSMNRDGGAARAAGAITLYARGSRQRAIPAGRRLSRRGVCRGFRELFVGLGERPATPPEDCQHAKAGEHKRTGFGNDIVTHQRLDLGRGRCPGEHPHFVHGAAQNSGYCRVWRPTLPRASQRSKDRDSFVWTFA